MGLLSTGTIEIDHIYIAPNSVKNTAAWDDLCFAVGDAWKVGKCLVTTSVDASTPGTIMVGEVELKVVYPEVRFALLGVGGDVGGHHLDSNDLSAVVKAGWRGDATVLCAADVTPFAIRSLLGSGVDLAAPVFVFPHHGGRIAPDAIATDLLESVAPSHVVFSHGRARFRNPDPRVVELVKARGANVVCTQLSDRCSSQEVERVLDLPGAGRFSGRSCAGTVEFKFPISHYEGAQSHRTFISLLDSAMCIYGKI